MFFFLHIRMFSSRSVFYFIFLPEPEPGGAEPGNPSPSINDITSRPDQHGGSSDQPPGTAQQAVGATIPRIYDPRACSVVLWKHSVVREVQHLGVCSRRTSANEERRGQTWIFGIGRRAAAGAELIRDLSCGGHRLRPGREEEISAEEVRRWRAAKWGPRTAMGYKYMRCARECVRTSPAHGGRMRWSPSVGSGTCGGRCGGFSFSFVWIPASTSSPDSIDRIHCARSYAPPRTPPPPPRRSDKEDITVIEEAGSEVASSSNSRTRPGHLRLLDFCEIHQ
ncbi:unnamed protein product [Nesidiocoris tenuis]|uniref:Uncharacterized protein n=1 Tax=Nesidiocoris tenuis TaxID=355587 RepID=A0A6H5GAR6_9HEMI|nr:unnamed protein product [Nesidiocoris tenuis]